ncbi:hypothetical protein HU200_053895 [Digitaria exilis]|uniref:Uncharacterized protein n=1 Tax=Digitaria exilis TaxID=1010633 RepID=A0A835AJI3_9POAL|nr:hypothetical protein HU200_053895 [Digitaria exilis]
MYGRFTRCDDCALALDAIDPLTLRPEQMARTRQTPRRPKMSELPYRVAEYPLKRQNPDTYKDWAAEELQQKPEEEDPEEREPETSKSAVGEQEEQMVATTEEEMDADPGDAFDDDEVTRSRTPVLSPHQIAPRTPRWIVYNFVWDGGDHFYHNRLLRVLRARYSFGRVGVEYRSEWWTHVLYRSFWRTSVHVRVTDEISVHYALSDHDTQEVGIADAAHQAYHVYRHKCFAKIKDEPERYHPRRQSGATACTIASTADEKNEELQHQLGGPAPRSPEYPAVDRLEVVLKANEEGNFKPNWEQGELSYALGTPEHTSRVRGMGVIPWKHGFSGDLETYRSRSKAENESKFRALEERMAAQEERVSPISPPPTEPLPPPTADDPQHARTEPSVSSPAPPTERSAHEKKEAWEKAPKKPPPVPQKPASPPTENLTRKQLSEEATRAQKSIIRL